MICPEEIAASVTAAAIAISKALPPDRAALLAAVLTQLGDTLATLAAANDVCQNICEHRSELP